MPARQTPATRALTAAKVAFVLLEYEHDPARPARARQARRAGAAQRAEKVTGYVTGGISPFGQRRRLPTLVDESALAHDTVYVSGGRRGLEIAIAPADLIALTGARTRPLARS